MAARRRGQRDETDRPTRGRRLSWHRRLDRMFFPLLGPAQVGPYDVAPEAAADTTACPACGALMTAHRREHVGGKTRVYCPAP